MVEAACHYRLILDTDAGWVLLDQFNCGEMFVVRLLDAFLIDHHLGLGLGKSHVFIFRFSHKDKGVVLLCLFLGRIGVAQLCRGHECHWSLVGIEVVALGVHVFFLINY